MRVSPLERVQVAHGLSALHADGGIHRNINAGNVYLDEKRRAKLGGYQCLKVRTPRNIDKVGKNNIHCFLFYACCTTLPRVIALILAPRSIPTACINALRVSCELAPYGMPTVQSILRVHCSTVSMEERYSLRFVNQPQHAYANICGQNMFPLN